MNDTFALKQGARRTENLGFSGMLLSAEVLAVGGAVLGVVAAVE